MFINKKEIVSCIVIDTISNKDKESIDRIISRFKGNVPDTPVFNMKYLAKCPVNSIIAKVQNPSKYMILYPFFSSHVSLPIKPGEHVWAFFPGGVGRNDIGYWMTRRSTDSFIEDPNFTHNSRSVFKVYNNTLMSENKNADKGIYYSIEGRGVASYEQLCLNTEGNSSHVWESIQRTPLKPSDLMLQGSNNTQLLLTNGSKEETGTIILTAGRGKTSETASEKIFNNLGLPESNKASKLSKIGKENEKEGHLDILNDRAVLILSENPAYINDSLPEGVDEHQKFNEEISYFFAKADHIRNNAINTIEQRTSDYFLETDNGTISSNDFNINASSLSASTSTFSVSTNGWSVDMQTLFDIIEEIIDEVNKLATGSAVFATGVGPTGPATNAAKITSILSKMKGMRG